MKFTALKNDFIRKANFVAKVIPSSEGASLNSLCFEAKSDEVIIRGMGDYGFLTARIPAIIEEEGKCRIWGKRLLEVLSKYRTLAFDEIKVVSGEEKIRLSTGKTGCNVGILSEEGDFDLAMEYHFTSPCVYTIKGNSKSLQEELKKTVSFSSEDRRNTDWYGVFFVIDENKDLHLISSDRMGLAHLKSNLNTLNDEPNIHFLLPTDAISTIIKILDEPSSDEEVVIEIGENDVFRFQWGDYRCSFRILSPDFFPNWKKIQPGSKKFHFLAEDLSKALSVVSLYAHPDYKAIKIDIEENKMTLSSKDNYGDASNDFEIPNVLGYAAAFWLNVSFLQTFLGIVDGEVTMVCEGNTDPVFLYPIANPNECYTLKPLQMQTDE